MCDVPQALEKLYDESVESKIEATAKLMQLSVTVGHLSELLANGQWRHRTQRTTCLLTSPRCALSG